MHRICFIKGLSSLNSIQKKDYLGVSELDLSSSSLFTIPDCVYELVNLITLDLSYNNITYVKKKINNLKNLINLRLNANFITTLKIYNLKNLTHINLCSNNFINGIPVELYKLFDKNKYFICNNKTYENINKLSIKSKFIISRNHNEKSNCSFNLHYIVGLKNYFTKIPYGTIYNSI